MKHVKQNQSYNGCGKWMEPQMSLPDVPGATSAGNEPWIAPNPVVCHHLPTKKSNTREVNPYSWAAQCTKKRSLIQVYQLSIYLSIYSFQSIHPLLLPFLLPPKKWVLHVGP